MNSRMRKFFCVLIAILMYLTAISTQGIQATAKDNLQNESSERVNAGQTAWHKTVKDYKTKLNEVLPETDTAEDAEEKAEAKTGTLHIFKSVSISGPFSLPEGSVFYITVRSARNNMYLHPNGTLSEKQYIYEITPGEPLVLEDVPTGEYLISEDAEKASDILPFHQFQVRYRVDNPENVETAYMYGAYVSSGKDTFFYITNTYSNPIMNFSIQKEWNDDDNSAGLRPDSITVDLVLVLEDGSRVKYRSVDLREKNKWFAYVLNVPSVIEGQAVKEVVWQEHDIEGYQELEERWTDIVTVEGNPMMEAPQTYDTVCTHITNTLCNSTLTLSKVVNLSDGIALPDEAVFHVQVRNDDGMYLNPDGTLNDELVYLDLRAGETLTFDHLPEGTYYVIENRRDAQNLLPSCKLRITYQPQDTSMMLKEGTVVKVTPKEPTNVIITNTYEVPTADVSVEKIWDDRDNSQNTRPESLNVDLIRIFTDGSEDTYQTVTLNEDNDWFAYVLSVPMVQGDKEVERLHWQEKTPGYYKETSRKVSNRTVYFDDYKVLTECTTITNTLQTGQIVINKQATLDGQNIADMDFVYHIIIQHANGMYIKADGSLSEEVAFIEIKAGKQITINNVPIGYISIEEDHEYAQQLIGYAALSTSYTYTYGWETIPVIGTGLQVMANTPTIIRFTNAYKTVDHFGVRKRWSDNDNSDNLRPENLAVDLVMTFDDGSQTVYKTIYLNEGNHWTYYEINVPLYIDGKLVSKVTWEEHLPHGYIAGRRMVSRQTVSITEGETVTRYSIEVTELTNFQTHDVMVTKVWDDGDNADGLRKDVVLQLFGLEYDPFDPDAEPEKIPVADPVTISKDASGDELTVVLATINRRWLDNPDMEFVVVENEIEGYETTITGNVKDGFTVTNKHEYEKIDYEVVNEWDDEDDVDGLRPDNLLVQLYADGEPVGDPIVLDGENDWNDVWEDLPKNKDGEPINYSVELVEEPDGYTVTYNPETYKTTIISSHAPTPVLGDSNTLPLYLMMTMTSVAGASVMFVKRKEDD